MNYVLKRGQEVCMKLQSVFLCAGIYFMPINQNAEAQQRPRFVTMYISITTHNVSLSQIHKILSAVFTDVQYMALLTV